MLSFSQTLRALRAWSSGWGIGPGRGHRGRRGGPSGLQLTYVAAVASLRPWFTAPLWLAAAACLALPVVDRALGWADTSPRNWFIAVVFLCVSGAAAWGASCLRNGPLRLLPFAILLLALGNEASQRLTRHRYAASAPRRTVGATDSLWRPITTTDLVTHFYEIPANALQVKRLRVAQISDLHVSPQLPKAYFEAALDSVVATDPDLILLTGDYVSRLENVPLFAQLLPGRLHARLGVFAVLGNHDFWTAPEAVRQILSAAGITLVSAGCVRLPAAVGRVLVCGTEAPWGPTLDTPLAPVDLSLVMSHTPDNIYDLSALGASVVFSGHTHGGQGRVPGFGAVIMPSRYGRVFDEGHFRVGKTDLFVSSGVGADTPPLRVYCSPDVIVVDFVNTRGR
jgi:predicted MPP superfamily phosphohydrolase